MAYLRSVPVDLDEAASQLSRFGALVPLQRPAPARIGSRVFGFVLIAALGLIAALLRCWRQAIETRRARRHLMQLDDRLLRDIGLTRGEVRFGDFTALDGQRRSHR